MRAYFFTNMYLSSIQNGIQPAHCLHQMFRKYQDYDNLYSVNDRAHEKILYDWADNHKTIIVKNGGDTNTMLRIKDLCGKMNLPSAYFNEPSLDNTLTCVGIIVPERLYNRDIVNKLCESWKRSKIENDFIDLIQSTSMAK